MKSSLRLLLLSAMFAFAAHGVAADRWSSDEVAVRMGVNAWLSLWTRPLAASSEPGVRSLYATQPSPALAAAVQTASQTGALPSAMHQNDRVAVAMHGNRAITTVELATRKVALTWERRSGLWRIVEESIAPDATERIALSEPARK
jgi:hypothetical protein